MSIEWNENLETNIAEIDTQHKKLFSLIGELEALIQSHKTDLLSQKSKILQIISSLEQYTLSHFLIEERTMEENQYPDLENHKLLHDKFTEKIYDTKKSIRDDEHLRQSDAFYSFLEGLLKFLNTWLKNHIMIKDMEYKPYIKHVL